MNDLKNYEHYELYEMVSKSKSKEKRTIYYNELERRSRKSKKANELLKALKDDDSLIKGPGIGKSLTTAFAGDIQYVTDGKIDDVRLQMIREAERQRIIFLYRHICFCVKKFPGLLSTLERGVVRSL